MMPKDAIRCKRCKKMPKVSHNEGEKVNGFLRNERWVWVLNAFLNFQ